MNIQNMASLKILISPQPKFQLKRLDLNLLLSNFLQSRYLISLGFVFGKLILNPVVVGKWNMTGLFQIMYCDETNFCDLLK